MCPHTPRSGLLLKENCWKRVSQATDKRFSFTRFSRGPHFWCIGSNSTDRKLLGLLRRRPSNGKSIFGSIFSSKNSPLLFPANVEEIKKKLKDWFRFFIKCISYRISFNKNRNLNTSAQYHTNQRKWLKCVVVWRYCMLDIEIFVGSHH